MDSEFIHGREKQIVKTGKRTGRGNFTASTGWRDNFVKRNNLSLQKKTVKKAIPVEGWIPKILKFHQYAAYGMAYVYFRNNGSPKGTLNKGCRPRPFAILGSLICATLLYF